MKNFTTVLFSCAALLSASVLMAQSSYSSYPQGGGYSSSPRSNNYSSGSYASNQITWLTTYSEAVAQSQATSKPILILFTGTGWCPACINLERTVLNHPEFAQAIAQRFIFLRAEFPDYSETAVMASPFKPLIDRYGVNAFPSMIVVNANGQTLFTVNYRQGGPQVYIQELLQKLNQGDFQGNSQGTSTNSFNSNTYNQF